MTADELDAILDGVAPAIRECVIESVKTLEARVKLLEERPAITTTIVGEKGDPGEIGPPGKDGPQGPAGERGLDGAAGPAGTVGEPGAVGPSGPAGERGPEGPIGMMGLPGRDGLPGVQGPQGDKGIQGEKGLDGKDGRDGADGTLLSLKALAAAMRPFLDDDGRTMRWAWEDGSPVEGWAVKTLSPVYRGVYESGKAYDTADVITRGGSLWIAKRATQMAPQEHGEGARDWQLCVKEGRPGKPGAQGLKGMDGKDGRPGRDLTNMGPDGSKWG